MATIRRHYTNICKVCDKEFHPFYRNQPTCSDECGIIYRAQRRSTKVTKTCIICNKEYQVKAHRVETSKYCSKECWSHRNPPITKTCPICGTKYETRTPNQRTCSNNCSYHWRSIHLIGEKSPAWKNGASLTNERARNGNRLNKWRQAVYARDDYTCQECSYHGDHLNAHHLKSFADHPELRYDVSNGIALCEDCHGKLHGKDFSNRRTKTCPDCGKETTGRGDHSLCRSCSIKRWHKAKGNKQPKTCPQCGKQFCERIDNVYCSQECATTAQITSVTVHCATCGKEIQREQCLLAKNQTGKFYCSNACRAKHTNTHVQVTCPICSKQFSVKAYRTKGGKTPTCSKACGYKMRGLKYTRQAVA